MKASNYEGFDDLQLINAYRAGKEKAFETLMKRHERFIMDRLCSVLGDCDNYLLDCFQNVNLKVWLYLQKKDLRPPFNFRGWLSTICKHEAIDQWRECNKIKTLPIEDWGETPTSSFNPGVLFSRAEIFRVVLEMIDSLTETQKVVVQLKLDGFSYEEIAETTKTDVVTCKGQFFRGIRKLRISPKIKELIA